MSTYLEYQLDDGLTILVETGDAPATV